MRGAGPRGWEGLRLQGGRPVGQQAGGQEGQDEITGHRGQSPLHRQHFAQCWAPVDSQHMFVNEGRDQRLGQAPGKRARRDQKRGQE